MTDPVEAAFRRLSHGHDRLGQFLKKKSPVVSDLADACLTIETMQSAIYFLYAQIYQANEEVGTINLPRPHGLPPRKSDDLQ